MNRDNKGFTLIELMLAMTFISFLLMAIAMTVIQISNIYTRGLTLKEVNQAGRSLSTELQRSISASPSFSIDTTAIGTKYIDTSFGGSSVGGRLCLGQYSYIWNYGKTLTKPMDKFNSNVYTDPSAAKIRFIKVPDSTGSYCSASAKASTIDSSGAVELLDVGDLDLAVHSFAISTEISASNSKTLQSLYYISFVLGTNNQAALELTGTSCKPPDAMASDLNYCSVNQFDIVAHAGNAVQ